MSTPGIAARVRELNTQVGCVVRPRLRSFRLRADEVFEHPFVCHGAHRERADIADEGRVACRLDVAERKEPFQRIVWRRDEAIKARGGVGLRLHVASVLSVS